MKFQYCCNPFNSHTLRINYKCKEITSELAEECSELINLKIIPGKKICGNCLVRINNQLKTAKDNGNITNEIALIFSSNPEYEEETSNPSTCTPDAKDQISRCLELFNISPLKIKGKNPNQINEGVKRKIDEISGQVAKKNKKMHIKRYY